WPTSGTRRPTRCWPIAPPSRNGGIAGRGGCDHGRPQAPRQSTPRRTRRGRDEQDHEPRSGGYCDPPEAHAGASRGDGQGPRQVDGGSRFDPAHRRSSAGAGFWLIAGRHRLMAAKKLKWPALDCIVLDDVSADQAELVEIDENLVRADLSPAEEAAHLGRRKELYELRHPATKRGSAGGRAKAAKAKGAKSQNETGQADAFIDDTAKKTGKGRSTIARKAARAKVVVLPEIIGTSLDKGAEIDALAKLPVEKQRSLAEAAKRGEQVSAISAISACDPEAAKTSDGAGKEPARAPTLDPRAWSMANQQEREAFVKEVG